MQTCEIFAVNLLVCYHLPPSDSDSQYTKLHNVTYFVCVCVCSGVYDILVGGKKVGSYDNTGSFGELALMYNMPRAATIIATTSGTLWAMVLDSVL